MEKMNTYPLEIHFTDRALKFFKSRRMRDQKILVNLRYYRPVSGGCCSGDMSDPIPTADVRIIENREPGEEFVKLESREGPSIYFAKSIYDSAVKAANPLIIDVTGFFRRTLKIEGLNLNYLKRMGSEERASCH
ncbi:MAG: hypothetical protein GTN76_04685 [Candidatus Aenigmarchaeota archaeon]|nr:hypothetical protein [Candidatus Aenigmarchaeota archaeon]